MATSPAISSIGDGQEPEQPPLIKVGDNYYKRIENGVTTQVEGTLQKNGANVAHTKDTAVQVEDLSAVEVREDKNIEALLDSLPRLIHEDPKSFLDPKTIETLPSGDEEIIQQFNIHGFSAYVGTYTKLDALSDDPKKYQNSAIAKRIDHDRQQYFNKPRPKWDKVKDGMIKMLIEENVEIVGNYAREDIPGNRDRWKDLAGRVHRKNYLEWKRSQDGDKEQDNPPTKAADEEMMEKYNKWKTILEQHIKQDVGHSHWKLMVDRAAAQACQRIEGKDIVMLKDGKNQIIAFVLSEATQKLFPEGTHKRMDPATKALFWRYPFKGSDTRRHPTQIDDHFDRHPNKNVHTSNDPHHAICSTEHCGLHHEKGAPGDIGDYRLQDYHYAHYAFVENAGLNQELLKFFQGVCALAQNGLCVTYAALAPEELKKSVEVNSYIPPDVLPGFVTAGETPYHYMAQLADVQTEGHTDDTDKVNGFAGITCFGEFTGGHLVLKQLGVMIEYKSGSHCHLRGRELHYFIMPYYNGVRHCLVFTCKDSVENAAWKMKSELAIREAEMRETSKTKDEMMSDIYKARKAAYDIKRKKQYEPDHVKKDGTTVAETQARKAAWRDKPVGTPDEGEAGDMEEQVPVEPAKKAKASKPARGKAKTTAAGNKRGRVEEDGDAGGDVEDKVPVKPAK